MPLAVLAPSLSRRLRGDGQIAAVLDVAPHLTAGCDGIDLAGTFPVVSGDVVGIVRSAEGEAQTVRGVVRLTSVAAMHSEYLVHHLPDLYARHRDLVIDLVDSDANLNIARHEADVAIRASRPESGDFIIRKLTVIGFAVY